jgi:hypothetical protein
MKIYVHDPLRDGNLIAYLTIDEECFEEIQENSTPVLLVSGRLGFKSIKDYSLIISKNEWFNSSKQIIKFQIFKDMLILV